MSFALSRAEVRELDRHAIEDLGLPGAVLMENAGRGAAELLLRLGVHAPVAICCGKGNNGGDGFVIARHLHNHGISVRLLLFARPGELAGDAAIHFQVAVRLGLPLEVFDQAPPTPEAIMAGLQDCEWVVDALFGTGLAGPVRPPFDLVIDTLNASGRRIFAVDIPSGLDCDTGQPLGATIRAERTATFVALKKGFVEPGSRVWTGQVHVIDIGLPPLAGVMVRDPRGLSI